MIDIDKLNRMLDEALSKESEESLNQWMAEQDRAYAEIAMNAGNRSQQIIGSESQLTASQEAAIENGMTVRVPYYASYEISGEFDINNDNDYNLAS